MIRALMMTCLCLFLPVSPGQSGSPEQPAPYVPLLGDIRVLGSLFTGKQEVDIWIPLPKTQVEALAWGNPSSSANSELSKADRAMLNGLRERFPALRSLDLIEKITVKHNAAGSSIDRQRGLLARGPKEIEDVVRGEAQAYVRLADSLLLWEVLVLDLGPAKDISESKVTAVRRTSFEQRRQELAAKDAFSVLTAPKVTTFHGQKAMISVANQTSYIKDFTSQVIEDTLIVDPVIDVISDGFTMELLGLRDPVRKHITIESRVKLSSLKRPIESFTTKLHGHDVTFQIPRVESCDWSTEAFELAKEWEGFRVTGLRSRSFEKGATDEPRNIEIWCFVSPIEDHDEAEEVAQRGVVERVEGNSVIVEWMPGLFPTDPWQSSPETVGFSRDGKPVGEGKRTGGFTTGDPTDARSKSFSVYRLTSGVAARSDIVF